MRQAYKNSRPLQKCTYMTLYSSHVRFQTTNSIFAYISLLVHLLNCDEFNEILFASQHSAVEHKTNSCLPGKDKSKVILYSSSIIT